MKYSKIEEPKKEFYCYLGLLSTKFALMEANIMKILGLLVVDDYILTSLLFEKNTLHQNIEFLKKVAKHRGHEKKVIDELICLIGNVKAKRNLFVHGVWSTPYELDNEVFIECHEPRLHVETEVQNGFTTTWTNEFKTHKFRLSYIKKLVEDINDIILAEASLIKRLEMFLEENNDWD